MRKPYLLLLFCFLLFSRTDAQENSMRFGIGYAGGMFSHKLQNLNVHAHSMNNIFYPYWTDKMEINPWFHGLNFELHMIWDSWGYFAHYQNRHMVFKGGGYNPGTQFDEEIELKVRMNTLGLIGIEWTKNHWILGGSLDIGSAKILIKRNFSDIQDDKYQYFYEEGGKILSPYTVMGTSLFLHYQLFKRMRLTAHYFHDFFGIEPSGTNGIKYRYKMSNLSLGATFDVFQVK